MYVVCITHLAQILCMTDTQSDIESVVKDIKDAIKNFEKIVFEKEDV